MVGTATDRSWGLDSSGEPHLWGKLSGLAGTPSGPFVDMDCMDANCCAQRADNTLSCWGEADPSLIAPPAGLEVIDFSLMWGGSADLVCALSVEHVVLCWGPGHSAAMQVPESLSPQCANGAVEPGEECDDNNLIDGDGCSSSCELEELSCFAPHSWTTVLNEDFDDGVADGWSPCTGCAGNGCPGVSDGVYAFHADWNRGCTPVDTSEASGVSFDFDLHAEVPLSNLSLSGGLPTTYGGTWWVSFDTVLTEGTGTSVRITAGEEAESITEDVLPPMILDASVRIEFGLDTGLTCVWANDVLLAQHVVSVPEELTTWTFHAYTDYSCCGGNMPTSHIDNLKVQTR